MKFKTRRPSAALIVSAAALVFAVGGTAIAADPVSKLNRSKVRGIAGKVVEQRAPGLNVARATTATNAVNATRAVTALQAGSVAANGINDAAVPNLAFTKVTTFANSWTATTGRPPAHAKSVDGVIHLSGAISGGAIDQPAFQLPPGSRPGTDVTFATVAGPGVGRIAINAAGQVVPAAPANVAVSLDGITFPAAP